jgi:hypothetical protein
MAYVGGDLPGAETAARIANNYRRFVAVYREG